MSYPVGNLFASLNTGILKNLIACIVVVFVQRLDAVALFYEFFQTERLSDRCRRFCFGLFIGASSQSLPLVRPLRIVPTSP